MTATPAAQEAAQAECARLLDAAGTQDFCDRAKALPPAGRRCCGYW